MPEIDFWISRESGNPDLWVSLKIPEEIQLPKIPYQWDGKPAYKTTIFSQKHRSESPRRVFRAVACNFLHHSLCIDSCVKLVWVDERREWIAYEETIEKGLSDNYGFSDDDLTLEGPWSLDTTHQKALLEAYNNRFLVDSHLNLNISRLSPVILSALEEITPSNLFPILTCELQKKKELLATPPEEILEEMSAIDRSAFGGSSRKLSKIAQALWIENYDKKKPILLSGWHLDGEYHGGYEYEEEDRDFLGTGVLLYQKSCAATHSDPTQLVEIWRQQQTEGTRAIFLAFRKEARYGYFGIDNHHGTEHTWKIVGLRILRTL